jgi:adenosylcobinamide-GDP ribazoletransferase
VAALLGLALPVIAGLGPVHTMVACGTAVAAAALVTGLAFRHLGGHTGDIGGACQQASELGYLLGLLVFPALG